jgi:hypothetical protein
VTIAPPKPSAALAPGNMLDRYELICPIAEGGMGVCWLARLSARHGFERLVAIKTMKGEYANDPDFERMFLDEARIASRIEHTNVAHILELGDHDGVLFMVMEFVDGDSLFKLRREVANKGLVIPCGIAVRILADTLGGLHAAHDLADASGTPLGVVHRDVSPQNILVNTKGVAKLIDFGIAKARDRTAGDTSTGTIKGKLHFMAPEQALGRKIDRRTDVFSIGSILYYLLSGKYAYHGETQAETILKLAEGKPPLPLPKSVPPEIATVIMRALSFDPAKRFATAAEMESALEAALVATGNATTCADVAAYLAEHIGHRAQARKKAIDAALAALAGGVSAADRPLTINNSDKFTAMSPEAVEQALSAAAEAGTPLQTDPGSATLGDSSMMLTPAPSNKRRVPVVALAAGGAVGLVIVLVVAIGALRSHPAADPTAGQSPAPSAVSSEPTPVPTESAAPAEVVSAAPTEEPSAEAAPSASASSAAPSTKPSATATHRTVVPWVPPTHTTAAPSSSAKKKKRRVDDGF